MDWIRLGHSGKDLTSVGGKKMPVTREELQKHNKPDDAWMAFRGKSGFIQASLCKIQGLFKDL